MVKDTLKLSAPQHIATLRVVYGFALLATPVDSIDPIKLGGKVTVEVDEVSAYYPAGRGA